MMGYVNITQYNYVNPWVPRVFMFLFVFIMVWVVSNIVIAILMNGYEKGKEEVPNPFTGFNLVRGIFGYFWIDTPKQKSAKECQTSALGPELLHVESDSGVKNLTFSEHVKGVLHSHRRKEEASEGSGADGNPRPQSKSRQERGESVVYQNDADMMALLRGMTESQNNKMDMMMEELRVCREEIVQLRHDVGLGGVNDSSVNNSVNGTVNGNVDSVSANTSGTGAHRSRATPSMGTVQTEELQAEMMDAWIDEAVEHKTGREQPAETPKSIRMPII